MKTKELIEMLEKIDPEGDSEVVVREAFSALEVDSIKFIAGANKMKGAYRGPYLSKIASGYMLTDKKDKVVLDAFSFESIIINDPATKVYINLNDNANELCWAEKIDKLRESTILHKTYVSPATERLCKSAIGYSF